MCYLLLRGKKKVNGGYHFFRFDYKIKWNKCCPYGLPHERHTLRGFTATHLFPLKHTCNEHRFWQKRGAARTKRGRVERLERTTSPPTFRHAVFGFGYPSCPSFCFVCRSEPPTSSTLWNDVSSTLSFRGCLKRLTNTALLAMARWQSDHKARRSKLRFRERNGTEHTTETQRWI